ncbi:glycosyltransferase [Gemmatimonas phototrophica]|uniref:glycosyltransferase n=1 Tax=Gemmatimonas phototrophica TaxID=1379270 RepID=UPI001314B6D7|nr:glycosyltransferase [Gemmatimonas phototrophica]
MERFVISLAAALSSRGWRTTIYCTQRGGPLLAAAADLNIEAKVLPFETKWDNLAPRRLIREMRADGIQLVHSQNGNWLAAAVAARWLNIPLLHTEHGLEGPREHWKLVLQKRAAAALTGRLVAVSQSLQRQLKDQLGLSLSRIQVIPNGIDTAVYRPDAAARQSLRQELGIGPDTVLIGALARLHPLKGIDVLAEAAALIPAETPVAIVVAGDGDERTRVEAIAARSAVPFKLLGMRSDIARLLQGFDALVLPSRSEALPIALLEGMASRRPIIATSVGEMPHIVQAGAGLVVPPQNPAALAKAIVEMVQQHERRAAFGSTASAIAEERFGITAMVDSYIQAYHDLLNR